MLWIIFVLKYTDHNLWMTLVGTTEL